MPETHIADRAATLTGKTAVFRDIKARFNTVMAVELDAQVACPVAQASQVS